MGAFDNHKEEPYCYMFISFASGKCFKKNKFVKRFEAILELDMPLKLMRKAIMLHEETLIGKFIILCCALNNFKYGSQSTKLLSHATSLSIIVAKVIICFYLTTRKKVIKYSNQVLTN